MMFIYLDICFLCSLLGSFRSVNLQVSRPFIGIKYEPPAGLINLYFEPNGQKRLFNPNKRSGSVSCNRYSNWPFE